MTSTVEEYMENNENVHKDPYLDQNTSYRVQAINNQNFLLENIPPLSL